MATTTRARAVWALWAVALILGALTVMLGIVDRDVCSVGWDAPNASVADACRELRSTGDEPHPVAGALFVVLAMAFATVGALVATRQPRNAVGWISLGIGVLFVAALASVGYAMHATLADPGKWPAGVIAWWVASWTFGTPATFTPLGFFFLLFPTGRLLSRRWRVIAGLLILAALYFVLTAAFNPENIVGSPSMSNPFGVAVVDSVQKVADTPLFFTVLFAVIASMASIVVRFRRSRGIERQQMKWFSMAAMVLGLALASTPVVFTTPALQGLWIVMFPLALATVPIASGIAILRYRLYDIDVIINRTLVYAALTAVLAGAYVGIVTLFQTALRPFTEGNQLAIAASTLAVAALFRPLRRAIQSFIDRRFYRRKYDAAKTVEEFSSRLRQEVNLQELTNELVAVVRGTMQPAHVTLWLRSPEATP